MSGSVEPLAVGSVIGDVIDMFVPSVDLVVSYPLRQVNNGCEIQASAVVERPVVQIGGQNHGDSLFTLVMTDPDAPSPSEPCMRELIHWIVSDIPTGTTADYGREILSYEAPSPTIGIHRCVFVLFKQLCPLVVMPPEVRHNFNTRLFALNHDLGLPVAAVYFNCHKQTGRRRR